jgi:heme exporter protein D
VLFTVLLVGTIIWGALGLALIILPFIWGIIRDFPQKERLLVTASLWFFELVIVFSCFKGWSAYAKSGNWGQVLWLLLPLAPLMLIWFAIDFVEKRNSNNLEGQLDRRKQRRDAARQQRRQKN